MGRIETTIIAIIALLILFFIFNQASRMRISPIFTIIILLMGILIVYRLVRTWIRGY